MRGDVGMELDYKEIGKRIARRRKELGLTQSELSEKTDISNTYMSSIERAVSIPSTEVIMRLALALDTTPDEFLIGTAKIRNEDKWRAAADLLRGLEPWQLELAYSFLSWLREQRR